MARKKRPPGSKAKRMTIYVDEALRLEMSKLEETWAISWSQIASEAFRKEVERLKKLEKKLK